MTRKKIQSLQLQRQRPFLPLWPLGALHALLQNVHLFFLQCLCLKAFQNQNLTSTLSTPLRPPNLLKSHDLLLISDVQMSHMQL